MISSLEEKDNSTDLKSITYLPFQMKYHLYFLEIILLAFVSKILLVKIILSLKLYKLFNCFLYTFNNYLHFLYGYSLVNLILYLLRVA